ncbi:DUF2007 domain-containing protein [Selenomonadales bacterium OttesenSCG-928-I06]|nr:DUF2007 domain-containing protein [Selenomonadales bacterium OttesenSCG-928-I06]
MPFCPTCRVEYRQEFTECVDCGEVLVEILEPLPAFDITADTEPVLLCEIFDDIEVSMLMEVLQKEGIPAMMKSSGAGQYLSVYMGFSKYGKEIYVPPHLVAEAREIMVGMIGSSALLHKPSDFDDFEADGDIDIKSLKKQIKTFFICGTIVVIVGIFYLISLLEK